MSGSAAVVAPAATAAEQPARSWWPIALYPAAFPLSFVLLIWGEAEINVLELVRPALIVIAGSLLITLVLSLLAGDRRFGGIAATAVTVGLVVDRPEASLLLLVVAALIVVLARIPAGRQIRFLPLVTRVLGAIAGIALLATVLYVAARPGFVPTVQEAFLAPPGPAERPMPPAGSPDIYVFLLDGYPGATASKQAPWFDAAAFPTALRDRGFTVHDDARTNYLLTRLVLPTMFDSRHVIDTPELAAPFGPNQAVDARRLRDRLERASGLAAIRAAGYDVVWVSAGWSHLDIRTVDRRIEAPGPSELEVATVRQSGAGNLLQAIDPGGVGRVIRERALAAFDSAVALAAEPHERPRFVFVHVPIPHPPNVFRADGSAEDGSPQVGWDEVTSFTQDAATRRRLDFAQVEASARIALEGIDDLRRSSARPPAIILFSDHGSDVGFMARDPMHSDLEERSSTLLASLTPGHPDLFAAPTTPINIIGTLTNGYLGTHVPRQPDVTYAFDGSILNVVPITVTPGD